jgi:ABC-type cobalamin/Fe3+-siderophores transport system ATPase subunit
LNYPFSHILRNISFEFEASGIICLLGNNGAGKSTLLKTCAGILEPDFGALSLNQLNVHHMDEKQRAQKIGWLAQSLARCEDVSVHEFMNLSSSHFLEESKLLNLFDLSKLRHQDILHLSGGEWKRLQLARLWKEKSQILLLDEPDSDLDPYYKKKVIKLCKQYVKENNAIVLVSTHDIFFAREIATRICVMSNGLLVWNSEASEFWNSDVIRSVYGANFFKE